MEQKRRTIKASGRASRRKGDKTKLFTVIGIVAGLILVFVLSYNISYGLLTSNDEKKSQEAEPSKSTEADIANMSREDLEKEYEKLKKQLEEKDDTIKKLNERIEEMENGDEKDEAASTPTPSDDDANEESNKPAKTPEPTPPPAATPTPEENTQQNTPPPADEFDGGGLMSPEDLANLDNATRD